jgi:hypothetical protein
MTRTTWRFSRPEYKSLAQALSLLLVCFAAIPAVDAGIVSVSGVTITGPPGGSINPGVTTTAAGPIIFLENTAVVAGGGMPVDHLVSGNLVTTPLVSGNIVNPLLVDGSIPAGTPYESYIFHFDPVDGPLPTTYPLSDILFSAPILGLQLFSNGDTGLQKPALTPYVGKLEAGDGIAFPPAYYPMGLPTRGIESGDALEIASGGLELRLAGLATGVQIDQIRVFVAVPEPGSLAMAFIAILGIMGLGRTRSRAVRS